MTLSQALVFAVILASLVLFVWGRWRYDLVALLALLALVLCRIVPPQESFLGFGHPAVVTVAAVLVVSRGLRNAGVVDQIARFLFSLGDHPLLQVSVLTFAVGVLSGFMNNVGALALLMPVAVQMARKSGRSASGLLMPLAFGSLLGGLTTLIGTPPNIVIAALRAEAAGAPFRMFDFTPVGAAVLVVGMAFILLFGWRLIPRRRGERSREELFEVEKYTAEVRLPKESPFVGKTVEELEDSVEEDATVVALVRGERRYLVPSSLEALRAGDILIVEGDSDSLKALLEKAGLELAETKEEAEEELKSEEVGLLEAVVQPNALLESRTARNLRLRNRYGVNLLAVARQGKRLKDRLGKIRFRAGDVILLQGGRGQVQEAIAALGCLPLAERELRLGRPRRLVLALGIFAGAIGSVVAQVLSVETAFVGAAVLLVLLNFLSLRELYESIDWPVIVLLGAMIPVGEAVENTGGAELIARSLLDLKGEVPAALLLGLLMAGTMALSNGVNNAAVAVLMGPIAVHLAQGLEASVDPFLMTVAVGASCTFLTPIGHQSNALVMGPGGYQFGDYWRLGLPLSLLVIACAVPLVLRLWPL